MSPRHLLPLVALLLVSPASAKDLRKRPGIGFNNQLGGIPALSVRFGMPTSNPVVNLQLEGVAGLSMDTTETIADTVCAGGRLLYGFVPEDNLNLYVAVGAAYVSQGESSSVRVQPALEAEAFLFGLENLGLSLAFGLNIDVGTPQGVSTFAPMPGFGAHYYF